jgi:hypothetical protein
VRSIIIALAGLAIAAPDVGAAKPPRPAKLQRPAKLHVTKVRHTTVSVAWKRVLNRRTALRRGHRVTRRIAILRNGRRVGVVRARRNHFTVRHLRCGTRYRIAVRALGRNGRRSPPTRLSVRTAKCRVAPPGQPLPPPGAVPGGTARHRVFAYYYLWWSASHWRSSLGPSYPFTASPLPLPTQLDAAGCNAVRNYPGVTVNDVPGRIYDQDDPGLIESDVRQAAAAGLAGFAVNWAGTGSASQTVADSAYTRRLQETVAAVHKINAEGIPFKLWLSYKGSATVRADADVLGDLAYFLRTYGKDPAFDRAQSSRPTVIWNGSRKYKITTLQAVSAANRSQLRIIGDETIWSAARAPYLDGDAYYWSSQNPYNNPQSFAQLQSLAGAVRATGSPSAPKAFVAPLAPGYNKELLGGSCVPRNGGQTLRRLFAGNAATRPEAWALISWNEITEGTHVDPMRRYGSADLDVLRSLIMHGG